jgi:hypothetical protein
MNDAMRNFARRSKSVEDSHRRLADGYVQKVNKNGIVELVPRRSFSLGPLRLIMLMVLVAIGFKAFILANIGEAAYLEKLTYFEIGSLGERAGAWLMQIDPATAWLAGQISAFL